MTKTLNQIIALLPLILAPMAWSQTIEQMILSKYYPNYSKAQQCYVAVNQDGMTYCVKLDASKTVKTAQGTMLYMLATGDAFDFRMGETNGNHADAGYVSMFVVNTTGNPKVESAKLGMPVGAYGTAPKTWTFHEFGPDIYGFLNEHSDMHGGYGGSHFVILRPKGNTIVQHWIGASSDNTGAVERNATSMSSKIKIDRTKSSTGLYPLIMTVNGYQGKTSFKNKPYTITYDSQKNKYVIPNTYPLKKIDY